MLTNKKVPTMRRVIAPIILIGCILSPNIQAQHSTTHTKEYSIHIAPGNIKFLEQIIPWGYTPHDTLPEYPGGIGELQKFIYKTQDCQKRPKQ